MTGQHPLNAEMMPQADIIQQLGSRPAFTSLDLTDLSPRNAELLREIGLGSGAPHVLDLGPKSFVVDSNIFAGISIRPDGPFVVN
jgi:hypothetical protein